MNPGKIFLLFVDLDVSCCWHAISGREGGTILNDVVLVFVVNQVFIVVSTHCEYFVEENMLKREERRKRT
jgi:hypothetical protein